MLQKRQLLKQFELVNLRTACKLSFMDYVARLSHFITCFCTCDLACTFEMSRFSRSCADVLSDSMQLKSVKWLRKKVLDHKIIQVGKTFNIKSSCKNAACTWVHPSLSTCLTIKSKINGNFNSHWSSKSLVRVLKLGKPCIFMYK